jgi:tetratricopeptide (TPR) repeat protein
VRGISTGEYLLTQCRVLWIYLRLIVAPVGLNLDRDISVSTGLLSPWTTLVGALALGALLAGLSWLARKRYPAAIWALGFFVLILPGSSVVAQADVMFEHRTYLPLFCLLIALGFLLERIPAARLTVIFAVLIPVMAAGTISRNADWFDEKSFWTDAVAKSPNKGRAWHGLAMASVDNPAKEREYLLKGLTVDPGNADLRSAYGILLFSSGQITEALGQFQRSMFLAGETAAGWSNIGGAYFQLHNLEASMSSFAKALQLDPCNYSARRNMMMQYSGNNDARGVWRAGEIPASCHMLPEQASELDRLRRQAGKP